MQKRLLPSMDEKGSCYWTDMYEERIINGFRCAAVTRQHGCVNGYVEVSKNHPAVGNPTDFEDNKYSLNIPCHGGITYGEQSPISPDCWIIGFDTNHAGDLDPTTITAGLLPYSTYKGPDYVWKELKELTSFLLQEI